MFKKEDLKKIEQEVRLFFQKMSFETEIDLKSLEDSVVSVNLIAKDPRILIGEQGHTLNEIQYLLGIVLRKKFDKNLFIDFDISNYKQRKTEYLKELARSAADEVILAKEDKILSPMSDYERRIVHLEIVAMQNVVSESIEDEPRRRVVVRYCP